MLVITCDNCCNLSRFCQELTGLFPYRKVQPNGLILFCLAGLSEPLSAGEEAVVLCSPALIPYRPNAERCLALLAFFLPFFQLIKENLLRRSWTATALLAKPAGQQAQSTQVSVVEVKQSGRRLADKIMFWPRLTAFRKGVFAVSRKVVV